jgi:hypothetical protein
MMYSSFVYIPDHSEELHEQYTPMIAANPPHAKVRGGTVHAMSAVGLASMKSAEWTV